MPFQGSQHANTIELAYFIGRYQKLLRLMGLILIAKPAYRIFTGRKTFAKILLSLFIILYGIIYFFFNFRFEADKMFYQLRHQKFCRYKNKHRRFQ